MAKQTINIGSAANDGTGSSLRAGGDLINDNFNEIYTALGDGSTLSSGFVTAASTTTFTNKTLDLGGTGNSVTGSLAEFNTALQGDSFVSLTGSETLTNKTLTTPTLTTPIANAGIQLKNGATSAGFLEFFEDSDNGTNKVTLIGPASTGDVTLTLPSATDTLIGKDTTDTITNKTIDLASNTVTGSLAEFNSALQGESFVTLTQTETLTSKTLTAPIIERQTITKHVQEVATVTAAAATGTINYDVNTQSILYYTNDATGNFTVNFRGDGSTTLNSIMDTGDVITVVFLVTNGSSAKYNNAFQIDGSSITPKNQGGSAYSSGNANSIDAYSYTIIKTGDAAFTMLTSQTQFA